MNETDLQHQRNQKMIPTAADSGAGILANLDFSTQYRDSDFSSVLNFADLASAAYYGKDQQIYEDLCELGELVGIEIIAAEPNRSGTFRVSRTGYDLNASKIDPQMSFPDPPLAVLNFTDKQGGEKVVQASFHPLFAPYFASGSVELNLRTECAEILELLAAVGATVRGQVLGVVGAQGGIGTSTTALWIAREFARRKHSAAVIDLNPVSRGIDLIFSGVKIPGKRWRDICGSGSMLANRLTQALPKWEGVRFLSADSRGGVDLASGSGEKSIAALSQVHEWTVLDLPTRVLDPFDPARQWLEWCDAVLLLSGTDAVSLAGTQARLADLPAKTNLAVVAVGAKNRGHLADIANQLGYRSIFGLRRQKSLAGDLEHGLAPGDKKRSNTSRDICTICSALLEAAQLQHSECEYELDLRNKPRYGQRSTINNNFPQTKFRYTNALQKEHSTASRLAQGGSNESVSC